MKRNVSLEEISDGRLYGINDMVKADCHGCAGCSQCCRGMGQSILLDPCDVYRFQKGIQKTLPQLLAEEKAELNVVDGCILPNLKMSGEAESCAFLDGDGRCSIHDARPGICRLFPLGRYYENGDFKYFLQIGECSAGNRSKIKVSKWIDTPNWHENHEFVCAWHALLKAVEQAVAGEEAQEKAKRMNMALLELFFVTDYRIGEAFYGQFYARLERFRALFSDEGL